MPIRTNRGRAAVYRRLWGAPLRSPKHLIATVAVVAALLTAIGFLVPKLVPGTNQPAGFNGAASSTSATATPSEEDPAATSLLPSPSETRLTKSPLTPTSAPPDPEAIAVAEKWARAWVDHPKGISTKEWLKGLKPYTTEEYLGVMESVDPANVPADKVTGEPEVFVSYTSSVDVDVPTDGPTIRITVVSTDSGWRVANYGEAV